MEELARILARAFSGSRASRVDSTTAVLLRSLAADAPPVAAPTGQVRVPLAPFLVPSCCSFPGRPCLSLRILSLYLSHSLAHSLAHSLTHSLARSLSPARSISLFPAPPSPLPFPPLLCPPFPFLSLRPSPPPSLPPSLFLSLSVALCAMLLFQTLFQTDSPSTHLMRALGRGERKEGTRANQASFSSDARP